jgi:hypothetical protein
LHIKLFRKTKISGISSFNYNIIYRHVSLLFPPK